MKKKILASLLAVCMIVAMLPIGAFAAGARFADTANHWGQAQIERWESYGVLSGVGGNAFEPNRNMTRAEFAQMLCNLMGYEDMAAANTFADVTADNWKGQALLKLCAAGVSDGAGLNSEGKTIAAPDAPITREMAAVMLGRALKITPDAEAPGFADDAQIASWAKGYVSALKKAGWVSGVDLVPNFAPKAYLTRAQAAQMMGNMVTVYAVADVTVSDELLNGGIVVTVGNAKVTLNTSTPATVIVAPKANGATVEVADGSTAAKVVVMGTDTTVTGEVGTVDVTDATGKVDLTEADVTTVVGEEDNNDVDVITNAFELDPDQKIEIMDGNTFYLDVKSFPNHGTLDGFLYTNKDCTEKEDYATVSGPDQTTGKIAITGIPEAEGTNPITYWLKVTVEGSDETYVTSFTFTPMEFTATPVFADGADAITWRGIEEGYIEVTFKLKNTVTMNPTDIFTMYKVGEDGEGEEVTKQGFGATYTGDTIVFYLVPAEVANGSTPLYITATVAGKLESDPSYKFKLESAEPDESGNTCGAGTVTTGNGEDGDTSDPNPSGGHTCGAGTVTTGDGDDTTTAD